jgi:putative FmdB family regulatory protein
MPIYAYRCTSCGHAADVLQKMSDPVLTQCPACHAATLTKQVTAAGFQLKGSGWYVTDFKGDKKPAKSVNDSNDSAPKNETPATGSEVSAPDSSTVKPAAASASASSASSASSSTTSVGTAATAPTTTPTSTP